MSERCINRVSMSLCDASFDWERVEAIVRENILMVAVYLKSGGIIRVSQASREGCDLLMNEMCARFAEAGAR